MIMLNNKLNKAFPIKSIKVSFNSNKFLSSKDGFLLTVIKIKAMFTKQFIAIIVVVNSIKDRNSFEYFDLNTND